MHACAAIDILVSCLLFKMQTKMVNNNARHIVINMDSLGQRLLPNQVINYLHYLRLSRPFQCGKQILNTHNYSLLPSLSFSEKKIPPIKCCLWEMSNFCLPVELIR